MKTCSNCNKELEVCNFTKDIHSDDGLYHICKVCRSKYRKELGGKRKLSPYINPGVFPDLPGELKECTQCHWALPISEFGLQKKGSTKLRAVCKKCRAIKNKSDWLEGSKRWNSIEKTFGITKEQYVEMFRKQRGRCGICGVPQVELTKQFAIDHDHETGIVRGLLCSHCNIMIGQAREKITILNQAIMYLENWR